MNITKDKNQSVPQRLLADLAANELSLVSLYLAAADTASRNLDEKAKLESLRMAFVSYCKAQVQVCQLPENEQEELSAELQRLHGRIQTAYFEEP